MRASVDSGKATLLKNPLERMSVSKTKNHTREKKKQWKEQRNPETNLLLLHHANLSHDIKTENLIPRRECVSNNLKSKKLKNVSTTSLSNKKGKGGSEGMGNEGKCLVGLLRCGAGPAKKT